jgi:hypothetical protein
MRNGCTSILNFVALLINTSLHGCKSKWDSKFSWYGWTRTIFVLIFQGQNCRFFAEHGMLVRLGQGLGVDKTASVPNQPAIPNTVSDFLSFAVCNLLATRFPSPSAVRIIA